MSRFVQAILVGVVIVFILDFFLFFGLLQNFIKPNEIDIFFNAMFVDNQNIYLLLVGVLFYGLMVMYSPFTSLTLVVLGVSAIIFLLPIMSKDITKDVAKKLFMQQNVVIKVRQYMYSGDIYYQGRKNTYFYDSEAKKLVKIENIKIEEIN